jgi:uncharacterized repeat protein (TIGR03809 family)
MANDHAEWNGEQIAGQWLAMAERRRDDLLELYRCGRWRRYHTEAELLALMRAVKADIEFWSRFVAPPPKNLRQATGYVSSGGGPCKQEEVLVAIPGGPAGWC